MILLDELANASARDLGVLDPELTAWRTLCGQAQRFQVHRDVVATAHRLQFSNTTTVEQALPLARLPYPVMWLETDAAARTGFDRPTPDKPQVIRVGAMIVATGQGRDRDTQGLMYLAWKGPQGLSLSPACCLFDLRAPLPHTAIRSMENYAADLRRAIEKSDGTNRERLLADFPATLRLRVGPEPAPRAGLAPAAADRGREDSRRRRWRLARRARLLVSRHHADQLPQPGRRPGARGPGPPEPRQGAPQAGAAPGP